MKHDEYTNLNLDYIAKSKKLANTYDRRITDDSNLKSCKSKISQYYENHRDSQKDKDSQDHRDRDAMYIDSDNMDQPNSSRAALRVYTYIANLNKNNLETKKPGSEKNISYFKDNFIGRSSNDLNFE